MVLEVTLRYFHWGTCFIKLLKNRSWEWWLGHRWVLFLFRKNRSWVQMTLKVPSNLNQSMNHLNKLCKCVPHLHIPSNRELPVSNWTLQLLSFKSLWHKSRHQNLHWIYTNQNYICLRPLLVVSRVACLRSDRVRFEWAEVLNLLDISALLFVTPAKLWYPPRNVKIQWTWDREDSYNSTNDSFLSMFFLKFWRKDCWNFLKRRE